MLGFIRVAVSIATDSYGVLIGELAFVSIFE